MPDIIDTDRMYETALCEYEVGVNQFEHPNDGGLFQGDKGRANNHVVCDGYPRW